MKNIFVRSDYESGIENKLFNLGVKHWVSLDNNFLVIPKIIKNVRTLGILEAA